MLRGFNSILCCIPRASSRIISKNGLHLPHRFARKSCPTTFITRERKCGEGNWNDISREDGSCVILFLRTILRIVIWCGAIYSCAPSRCMFMKRQICILKFAANRNISLSVVFIVRRKKMCLMWSMYSKNKNVI